MNNNITMDYSNPDNLYYYLINGSDVPLNVNVIKQKTFTTDIGTIELAIIGSSHYIKLNNEFTELLSCSHESVQDNLLIEKQQNSTINFSHTFNKLNYTIKVHTENKNTSSEFTKEEQLIYNQDNNLKHFFCNGTSLTALQLTTYKNKCVIKTWHSYPEHLKIVYSTTEISKLIA